MWGLESNMSTSIETNFVRVTVEQHPPQPIKPEDINPNDVIAVGLSRRDMRVGTAKIEGSEIVIALLNDQAVERRFPIAKSKIFKVGCILSSAVKLENKEANYYLTVERG
jgi:hypothetical protein